MKINRVPLAGENSVSGSNNPQYLIIHHPEFYGSIERLNDVMRNMGFTMIGYNYYVRKDGTVWKGRPDNVTSGNCYGYNTKSLGICFEGNYDKDTSMPEAQFKAGVELIKELRAKYGISNSHINGHKHYYNTACPGKYFPLDRMLKAIKGGSTSGGSSNVPSYRASLSKAKEFVGDKCAKLQKLLIKAGYNCGGYGADGDFGKGTYDSLVQFQKDHGLVDDALAGTNTFNKLEAVTSNKSGYDKEYAQTGRCTVVAHSGLKIRAEAYLDAEVVGVYAKGEHVNYDRVVESQGYRWISWIGGSGKRRYMAVRKLSTNEILGKCV